MARKNLLKGLMEPRRTKSAAAPAAPPQAGADRARLSKGAIGAVNQSIAELKRRAINELDPNLIDAGGVQDRLEHDDAEHARLMESLRDYGQQVPVLVRPNPENQDRYQIVYGRRRVLALRDLGLPVKAMIRDLDDQELVLAQGQENSARRDLSFIEKANFARQMRDAGYKRKIICDALHIDKTLISRMLSVADRIPEEVMLAVGSAPSTGRDRWIKMADYFAEGRLTGQEAAALAYGETSDTRFEALMKAMTIGERTLAEPKAPPRAASVQPIRGDDGQQIGEVRRNATTTMLTLKSGRAGGFDDWLAENIEEIYRDWRSHRGEP